MIVISPGLGFGLSSGIYCLTARCKTSSCSLAVAWAYSRICWHGTRCSTIRNLKDISMAGLRIKVFFVAVKDLRYLVESIDMDTQQRSVAMEYFMPRLSRHCCRHRSLNLPYWNG